MRKISSSGFIVLEDPVKEGVADTIKKLKLQGIS